MSCVFFWRLQGDNAWLSNWSPHPVVDLAGHRFPTAEHHIMFLKAELMGDRLAASAILRAPSPAEAKRLGRLVRNWDEARWVAMRESLMFTVLYAKASQNPAVGERLLQTGECLIAEASPFDRVWGIGLPMASARVTPVVLWPGLGLLGKQWMEVRTVLREAVEANVKVHGKREE